MMNRMDRIKTANGEMLKFVILLRGSFLA